jgi:glycosyltransferase involved in cell wall biosynthesis
LNILLLHNYYLQPGGEDVVFANEAGLLESHGHTVIRYRMHNEQVSQAGTLSIVAKTLWNRDVHSEIRKLIRDNAVDICHCHNTFPLISPSAYYAARDEGVPVVQTLHNYRLLCPKAVLYRDGRVCEDCVGSIPWRSVWHACYRDSRPASAVTTLMLTAHRIAGTWQSAVDVYIALTEFCRTKWIDTGLPADRVVVKPNFLLDDPGPGRGGGGYALFAGRLTEEKGVRTLLQAWTKVTRPVALKIAGTGPLAAEVAAAAASNSRIEYLGAVSRDRMIDLMSDAEALIFPSEWYEAGPMTIIEAFACGTPVIASQLGSAGCLIADGQTGFHFTPGDAGSLARTVDSAWSGTGKLQQMRTAARGTFEQEYTADHNYRRLMDIYSLAGAGSRVASTSQVPVGAGKC